MHINKKQKNESKQETHPHFPALPAFSLSAYHPYSWDLSWTFHSETGGFVLFLLEGKWKPSQSSGVPLAGRGWDAWVGALIAEDPTGSSGDPVRPLDARARSPAWRRGCGVC